jgi:high-affinity nickel-transport protein
MDQLPNDWLALVLMVFALGVKHGMDPDHLATIDGLARCNARRPGLARRTGVLFSLGHGAVVMLIAVAVGLMSGRFVTPAWLSELGAWISIGFLFAMAAACLRSVLRAPPDQVVRAAMLPSRFAALSRAQHPLLIACVGALFALSFDTVSQAALFSAAATAMSGWPFSALLGFVFTLGMLGADGLNGLWVAKLLARADRRALIASRVMGLSIAGLSLLVGTFGIARQVAPEVAGYSQGRELLFGIAAVVIVAVSFMLAFRLSDNRELNAATSRGP